MPTGWGARKDDKRKLTELLKSSLQLTSERALKHLIQKVKGKAVFVNFKDTQPRIPSEYRQVLSHQVAKATKVY